MKRYKVDFSGKSFPSHYPHSMMISAPNGDRAKEWGSKQLSSWAVPIKGIRVVVTECLAPIEVKTDASTRVNKKNKKARKKRSA